MGAGERLWRCLAAIGAVASLSTGSALVAGVGVAQGRPLAEPRIVGSSDATTGPSLTETGTYQVKLHLVVEITNGNEVPVSFACSLAVGGVVQWRDAGQVGTATRAEHTHFDRAVRDGGGCPSRTHVRL